jgi:hypothetical protein
MGLGLPNVSMYQVNDNILDLNTELSRIVLYSLLKFSPVNSSAYEPDGEMLCLESDSKIPHFNA